MLYRLLDAGLPARETENMELKLLSEKGHTAVSYFWGHPRCGRRLHPFLKSILQVAVKISNSYSLVVVMIDDGPSRQVHFCPDK